MPERRRRRGVSLGGAAVAFGMTAGLLLWVPTGGAQTPVSESAGRELAMKITEPFTLASVGDLLILRPMAQWNDPDYKLCSRSFAMPTWPSEIWSR